MNTSQLLVFYDSWCPLCTRAMKAIRKRDWHQAVTFISFRDSGVMDEYNLWGQSVEKRIYAISQLDQRTFSGIDTIYQIAKRIPSARILSPFIYLSIKIGLGERLYRYIAERRKIVPVGQCEGASCSVKKQ